MLKKILKYSGISLLVLIIAAIAIPFLFKGKIIAKIKEEINKSINAKVDFADVDISLFRHFPKLSVGLNNLSVVGLNEFAEDTLIATKQIDVAMNLMSAIKGDELTIYSINLKEPKINAIVNKEGKANWDIVKPDTATKTDTSSKPFKMKLEKYSVENGIVKYEDKQGGMSTVITNLNHTGSGDFDADLFTLKTATTADEVNFSYGGIPYLNKVKTSIDADIQVDAKNSKYTFSTDKIKLNELQLTTKGFFQFVNDTTYGMDIKFDAPSTSFKHILSFIPAIYANNFSAIKTSGDAVFNGFVKGNYNATQIPAYALNLDVKNGFFQYPDLPKAVKNINLTLNVSNPDGVTDHTVVNIPKAHIEFDSNPFDFRLLVKNPISNLFADAAATGKLNLADITQFVKMDKDTKLAGILDANAAITTTMNDIEKQQYQNVKASGTIGLNNFLYASKDYPTGVVLSNLLMTFNPKNVTLNNAAGKFMNTNFSANGYINNLLAYALQNKALNGVLNMKADNINLNEWMGVETDTTKKTEASTPFAVPDKMDITVNAIADKVHYDNLDIKSLTGSLNIADETVKLNNVSGKALDGTIMMNGTYSTKNSKKKPDISIAYKVANVDIQKTFYAFNTIQKLMPIGKFLAGKLSSQLTLTGKLGENMMPDLTTLSGLGDVLMLEGVLSKFQPLEKVSQSLNVSALQNVSAKDVKTFFEFNNGKVLVKPFNVKVKGIDMEIGGLHGLNQNMDYTINMKVPRALMGDKANTVVNGLVQQASNKGVPVTVGDIVPVQVKLGGSITSPSVKTDLKQGATSLAQDIKQQATDFAKAKADSAKTAVKDTLKSVKKQVIQTAKEEITKKILGGNSKDSSSNSGNKVEDTKKKIEEKGKGLLKGLNPFKKKQE